jgi:hypothetical protein
MAAISFPQTNVDARVAQEMKQTLYYTPAWLDLITELYGYSPIPLTSTNASGQVTGLLPLCFIQSPVTGRRLVSLPFSDHCPLLAADETSANDLVDQAIYLAHEKRLKYLELRTDVNDVLDKRTDLVAADLYVRWLTPLVANTDTVWRSIHKSARQRVKKAQRRRDIGEELEISSADGMLETPAAPGRRTLGRLSVQASGVITPGRA